MGWQRHQLDHMQITCTSLQTDNHASASLLNFFTGQMLFLMPNQQCQSTEGSQPVKSSNILHTSALSYTRQCHILQHITTAVQIWDWNYDFTFGSDVIRRKASVTCAGVAPPPTSRKLAGSPPCNLIMSIVAIARPAPFTVRDHICKTVTQRPQIGCLPYFHTWCGPSANLECKSEMCCMRLAGNTGRKKSPFWHHRTTLSGYIFGSKACIDNRKKKLVKQQYLLHMSS